MHIDFFLVPRVRLELTRPYEHCPLKTACLPIPPPGLLLAGVEGIEPPAYGFGDHRST